jgi:hypothetical protein
MLKGESPFEIHLRVFCILNLNGELSFYTFWTLNLRVNSQIKVWKESSPFPRFQSVISQTTGIGTKASELSQPWWEGGWLEELELLWIVSHHYWSSGTWNLIQAISYKWKDKYYYSRRDSIIWSPPVCLCLYIDKDLFFAHNRWGQKHIL